MALRCLPQRRRCHHFWPKVADATAPVALQVCKPKLVGFEIPKRLGLVAETWTPDNDLLTAAMKLKRIPIVTAAWPHVATHGHAGIPSSSARPRPLRILGGHRRLWAAQHSQGEGASRWAPRHRLGCSSQLPP